MLKNLTNKCLNCGKPDPHKNMKALCRSCFYDKKRLLFLKVEKTPTCWIYLGCKDKDGYGKFLRGGRAHRVSYEIHKGEIPNGMNVCHSCDNPPCVNPEHLWLGDNKKNIHDAMRKGRFQKGPKNGNAVLSEDNVKEIRNLFKPRLGAKLSRMFGISETQLRRIVDRESWVHVK